MSHTAYGSTANLSRTCRTGRSAGSSRLYWTTERLSTRSGMHLAFALTEPASDCCKRPYSSERSSTTERDR